MILLHLLYVFICIGARVSVGNVPKWPTAYHAKGTINIPYDEISEPFEAWYYNELGSSRVDYYNGTIKTYQLSKVGKFGTYFKLEPVLTIMKCFKTEGTKTDNVLPQSVLPDMTGFSFGGTEFINGVKAEKWERTLSESVLTMYVYWKDEGSNKVIQPLRFKQEGLDHYYMDFESFENLPPSSEVFVIKNVEKCIPLYDLAPFNIEHQLIHKFNPIKEFIDSDIEHIHEAWQSYKQQFKKHYNKNEDVKRMNIFRQRLRFIMSANRANLSYSLGINHMSDYTAEEMEALACVSDDGHFGDREQFEMSETEFDNKALPTSWDWRYRGAVTPVKDQATCGSCWAFMSTGAIEGVNFLNTNQLVSLSEQSLMDCAWNYGGKACQGAPIVSGFKWVIANKGIPSTRSYGPYMAMDNFCHVNNSTPSAEINYFKYIKRNCATCLKMALIKFGPVAVGMHANHRFKSYKNGVFADHKCPRKMNHAALIVGYGNLDGEEYWLVKNSWSNGWGVDGYGLVAIKGNICGIMEQPVIINP